MRTFESGPAVTPDGPLRDPPTIAERHHDPVSPAAPTAPEPERILLMVGDRQVTVESLIALLHQAIESDSRVATFIVEADGCDCVGEAVGIRVDLKRGVVLVAREGWKR